MPELVSMREYARRRKVTHRAVAKAVHDGRVSTTDGKIDPEKADLEWAENSTRAARVKAVIGTTAENIRLKTHYEAELKRQQFELAAGKLLDREETERELATMAKRIRDGLLAIPDRIDAILAATTVPADCNRIVLEEINLVLNELSSTLG